MNAYNQLHNELEHGILVETKEDTPKKAPIVVTEQVVFATKSHMTVQMEVQSHVTVSPNAPNLPTSESTIIDIPSSSSLSLSSSPAPSLSTTTSLVQTTPSNLIAASSVSSISSSSSYDTDSSTASSTCCTRHGEHIYMERTVAQQHQQPHVARTTSSSLPDASSSSSASLKTKSKYSYQKSWPIFILLISIVEISIFVFDQLTYKKRPIDILTEMRIPTNSVLIYRPDRRLQIWRFISYMFLHANWFHLGFNVIIQLFYGIPLEVMHGSLRVCIIYLAGVFAGSLGTSVVDSDVYLVGASGGVYALLAAHLANLMLNYAQMKYAVAQLVSVIIFALCDLGYAFYTQYLDVIELNSSPSVSYVAHLTGSLAGLTIGLLVLKNFEQRAYENVIWYLALGVYSAFTIFAIIFNLANTVAAQRMEEKGEVITQHLLHDLGVS